MMTSNTNISTISQPDVTTPLPLPHNVLNILQFDITDDCLPQTNSLIIWAPSSNTCGNDGTVTHSYVTYDLELMDEDANDDEELDDGIIEETTSEVKNPIAITHPTKMMDERGTTDTVSNDKPDLIQISQMLTDYVYQLKYTWLLQEPRNVEMSNFSTFQKYNLARIWATLK